MLAWIIANLFQLKKKDRFLIFLSGIIADIDGILIFVDWDLFISVHRKTNSIFVLLLFVIFVLIFSENKKKSSFGAASNYSLHIFTDLFFYKTYLFWPFLPNFVIEAYPSYGIQIILIPIFIVLNIGIIFKKKRTPLELISKTMDDVFVNLTILPFTKRCTYCGNRAFFKCHNCKRYLCKKHIHLNKEECNFSPEKLIKNNFWFKCLMFFIIIAVITLCIGFINSLYLRNFCLYIALFVSGSLTFYFSYFISKKVNFQVNIK